VRDNSGLTTGNEVALWPRAKTIKKHLEISDARFFLRATRQLTAAIAASEAMKKTTIVISKNVNVPRAKTFNAAAIAP